MDNNQFNKLARLLRSVAFLAAFGITTVMAENQIKVEEKAPPTDVPESILATLQSKAVRLFDGDKPVYDFWFRKEVPLRSKPESPRKSLDAIRETTLVGLAVAHGNPRDYKDNDLLKGACTMRLGIQPEDGDHLGTSEFPYYLVLIPVKHDQEANGITRYKQMVKASGRETSTDHPVILSLWPVPSATAEAPKLTEPAPDHKSIRISVPGKVRDSEQTTTIVFDLVFKGKGHF